MRYCTQGDIEQAIPAHTLIQLSQDDPYATAPDWGRIDAGVTSQEELIDGYLRGHYPLPISPVPSILRDIATQMVRYWLYSRRPEGNELPDVVKDAYRMAIRQLESIRAGRVILGEITTQATVTEHAETQVLARSPRFGDAFWGGYG